MYFAIYYKPMKKFNKSEYLWNEDIDYRKRPDLYRIGRGQQGVLTCQPYKDIICPHWKFKTPQLAETSSQKIYQLFLEFLSQRDFVGADLAKKYLHMGFTRSRRYANHSDGKKWATDSSGTPFVLPQNSDWAFNDKAQSAKIFKNYWELARNNQTYLELKSRHKQLYETNN